MYENYPEKLEYSIKITELKKIKNADFLEKIEGKRNRSLFNRVNEQLIFTHKSILEYVLAENFDKIKNGLNDNEDIYHRLYENYVSMCKLMLQHDQPDFDRIIKIGLKAKEIYINHLSNYYDLFRSYFVIVKAYEEKGELEQAGRTAADNVNYCVKLSTDIPSLNNYMILMRAYGNLAQIYKRLNDNGSLTEQIIELKEKISNINQWINNNYEGADFSYEF